MTFRTREREPMITIWSSLVQPNLDYCSPLWAPSPFNYGEIDMLEETQRSFTRNKWYGWPWLHPKTKNIYIYIPTHAQQWTILLSLSNRLLCGATVVLCRQQWELFSVCLVFINTSYINIIVSPATGQCQVRATKWVPSWLTAGCNSPFGGTQPCLRLRYITPLW